MGTSLIGLLIAFGIVLGPIFLVTENHLIFLSMEGLFIVIGGTFSAAFLTFPFNRLLELIQVIWKVFQTPLDTTQDTVREIVYLARETRGDKSLISQSLDGVKQVYLKDGLTLLIEKMEWVYTKSILQERMNREIDLLERQAMMLKTLGKYPPAFGLLATVIALVALLENMGKGGESSLGTSMAVGLVGTMYGIILSNFIFSPMGENILLKAEVQERNSRIVLRGLELLKDAVSPRIIQETLNSMLDPKFRQDLLGRA